MTLQDFRIGTRLGGGFAAVLTLLALSTVAGDALHARNKSDLLDGISVAQKKSELTTAMRSSLLQSAIAIRNIGLLADVEAMQKEEALASANKKRYAEARDKLTAAGLSSEEKPIVDELASLDIEMEKPFQDAIGAIRAFDSATGAKIIISKIDPLSQQAIAKIEELVQVRQRVTAKVTADSAAVDAKLTALLYALGFVGIAVGGVLAWLITRSIVTPLKQSVAVAERVAEGDLTARIDTLGKDEIADLLNALNRMNAGLSVIVGNVRAGAETITVAASEIATGNADLSSRTEQQAASIEETASSMEELTTTVRQNADNARQANQLATHASQVAVSGGAVVAQVVSTMGSINDSSKKIVDIISVIDGIAFQTNILALNAAVEAARAGEQGRGFAVVAAEVRNLAQRSAAAAKEIKGLIGDSVDKVSIGSKLVEQAGTTMGDVVASIKRVSDIVGEIAAASHEQSAGIEEVNRAIAQMDEATQQNAALVEQAAAATESMQDQAAGLSVLVSTFKISSAPTDQNSGDFGRRIEPYETMTGVKPVEIPKLFL
jgi:methyl-accepting chemotaxis protein